MADFSAALRNTLSKLGDPSPAVRQKVYAKARETVNKQIDAMAKRPPQAAIDRQFDKLDAAIAEIEADYGAVDDTSAAAPPTESAPTFDADVEAPGAEAPLNEDGLGDDGTEAELATAASDDGDSGLDSDRGAQSVDDVPDAPVLDAPAPLVREETAQRADEVADALGALTGAHDASNDELNAVASEKKDKARDPLLDFLEEHDDAAFARDEPSEVATNDADIVTADGDGIAHGSASSEDDIASEERAPSERIATAGATATSGAKGKYIALALVVLIGLGGWAAYAYKDQIMAALGGDGEVADVPVRTVPSTVVPADDVASNGNNTDAPEAASAGDGESDSVASATDFDTVEKFTQRVTEDGMEVDDGPLAGVPGVDPGAGEGTSVAERTDGNGDPEASVSEDGTPTVAETDDGAQSAALPVGQRALFYEERTGSQAGTSFPGAAIWSVSQEAPASGMEPEPSIRAEASVPDLGLVMELIIKRNGDDTLPASHLIELYFRVPDTFEGRGIADVQRVTFKQTEGDPGSALIAVPAPLDTNIFMVALNDAETAVTANTDLMRDRSWIDIPMQYVSGRRALITLEKGAAGEEVFEEVLTFWQENPIGVDG